MAEQKNLLKKAIEAIDLIKDLVNKHKYSPTRISDYAKIYNKTLRDLLSDKAVPTMRLAGRLAAFSDNYKKLTPEEADALFSPRKTGPKGPAKKIDHCKSNHLEVNDVLKGFEIGFKLFADQTKDYMRKTAATKENVKDCEIAIKETIKEYDTFSRNEIIKQFASILDTRVREIKNYNDENASRLSNIMNQLFQSHHESIKKTIKEEIEIIFGPNTDK